MKAAKAIENEALEKLKGLVEKELKANQFHAILVDAEITRNRRIKDFYTACST